ncbi:mitogen-activated protein kinase, partial [Tribonema minus]
MDREKRKQLLDELKMLHGLDCSNLIELHGAYYRDGCIHVVLEFMDMGCLGDMIHAWGHVAYDEQVMAAAALQVLWGLAYLHFERRLHRDIKPQNILLSSLGEVKLGDFGISRHLEEESEMAATMVGTIRYMSPERLAGEAYGAPGDIWSLGVLLL